MMGQPIPKATLEEITRAVKNQETLDFRVLGLNQAEYDGLFSPHVRVFHKDLYLKYLGQGKRLMPTTTEGIYKWQQIH